MGVRIKNIRIEKGLTQKEVADGIGCSVKTISRWEQGKYEISPKYYKKLKKYFDLNMEDFFEDIISYFIWYNRL